MERIRITGKLKLTVGKTIVQKLLKLESVDGPPLIRHLVTKNGSIVVVLHWFIFWFDKVSNIIEALRSNI